MLNICNVFWAVEIQNNKISVLSNINQYGGTKPSNVYCNWQPTIQMDQDQDLPLITGLFKFLD
jgi:hypothetical protein